jgi:hypothetical protein
MSRVTRRCKRDPFRHAVDDEETLVGVRSIEVRPPDRVCRVVRPVDVLAIDGPSGTFPSGTLLGLRQRWSTAVPSRFARPIVSSPLFDQ